MTHEPEESDSIVVATKPTNNAEQSVAEPVEPRTGTKGNADQRSTRRAQDRESVSQALGRVRQAARQRKKERFTWLGFVLICDKSRRGAFRVMRKSRGDRMRAKLREIKEALRRRWRRPILETGKRLAQVVGGYFAYHAVPTNSPALRAFRYHALVLWHRQLCRRSQRARLDWTRKTGLDAQDWTGRA